MSAPLQHFAVTLMVNHACNLRCNYCYTGAKFSAPMSWEIGAAGIDRAFRSLTPDGCLDVGFFGGEPLLEARRILSWMNYARTAPARHERRVRFNLTTNGTITNAEAWQVMLSVDLELAISFDGLPTVHDRHRRDTHGKGTAPVVEATICQVIHAGKACNVVIVVRPDNLEQIPEGLAYLYEKGVRQVNLSLDLWTAWKSADGRRLRRSIEAAAEIWLQRLPEFSINWFDAKAAQLAQLPSTEPTSRCGFGAGELAIAPSGRLYPCERLIGEDRPENPLRLPGHALEGCDFLELSPAPFARSSPCSKCALVSACDSSCRCSNFVRTGNVNQPDGLLCALNKASAKATADALARASCLVNRRMQQNSTERKYYA